LDASRFREACLGHGACLGLIGVDDAEGEIIFVAAHDVPNILTAPCGRRENIADDPFCAR
jgi:hypothetical protein